MLAQEPFSISTHPHPSDRQRLNLGNRASHLESVACFLDLAESYDCMSCPPKEVPSPRKIECLESLRVYTPL